MNFFAAEEAILSRLKDRVQTKHVFSAADLREVKDRSQAVPLVAVIYDGCAPTSKTLGAVQVTQRWVAVVGTREGQYTDPAMSNRKAAGDIVTEVILALHGWVPEQVKQIRALSLAQSQGTFLEEGLLLCPFVFTTDVIVSGN